MYPSILVVYKQLNAWVSFFPMEQHRAFEQLHAQEFVTLHFFAIFVAVAGREVVTALRGVIISVSSLLGWERIGKSIGMQFLLFSRLTSLPAPSNRFTMIQCQ